MSHIKGTLFHKRDGRLHIYQRNDNIDGNHLTYNWYGRCSINGQTKVFTSGTKNRSRAIKILEKKFDKLHLRVELGDNIHSKSFKSDIKEYLNSLETNSSIKQRTKDFYREKIKMILTCKGLLNKKVSNLTMGDINTHYLQWRMNNSNLKGATLKGDLTVIQGFLNWCFNQGKRKQRVTSLAKELLSKELRTQRTSRIGFNKEQYQDLLKVSRQRIKQGQTQKIRFERERLHQFIIFMVGTGLRVDECLNLQWEDVTFMDRNKGGTGLVQLDDDDRYYTKINVSKSKTGTRDTFGLASSYFSLQRLMKLYKETGLQKIQGRIFGVKSFRIGLNKLLETSGLKEIKIGDSVKTRDSKSFRNTFIQFGLDKGLGSNLLSKLCGTSSSMIDRYYTANTQLESMLNVLLKTSRTQLRKVS
jgi:integrase